MPAPPDRDKKVASANISIPSSPDEKAIAASPERQTISPLISLPSPPSPAQSVRTVSGVEAVIEGVNHAVGNEEVSQNSVEHSDAVDDSLSPLEEEGDQLTNEVEDGSGVHRESLSCTQHRNSELSVVGSSLGASAVCASMSVTEQREREQRIAIHQISRRKVENEAAWIFARSWQLNPWHPDQRVVAYLAKFGLEAKDQHDWIETPKESRVELQVSLQQHTENADATWYQLDCNLRQRNANTEASWQAPRRLKQIRCSLHDRVSLALGSRYNWLFEDAHFALPFAPRGTTSRLRIWFKALTDHINDGTLSPELVALTLFFLQVPILKSDGEESAAPDFYSPSDSLLT